MYLHKEKITKQKNTKNRKLIFKYVTDILYLIYVLSKHRKREITSGWVLVLEYCVRWLGMLQFWRLKTYINCLAPERLSQEFLQDPT